MAEIVNLRMARKKRAREAREAEASQNRIAFGRPKAEREAAALQARADKAHLDGHLREAPPLSVQRPDAPTETGSANEGDPPQGDRR